jgi:hypothetical protein
MNRRVKTPLGSAFSAIPGGARLNSLAERPAAVPQICSGKPTASRIRDGYSYDEI